MTKRADEADKKRKQRAEERDLRIAPPAEPNRRRDCLADPYLFLPTYFPRIFYQPCTPGRRQMIDAIEHVARNGGDLAIAGPRGDGKTRTALFVALLLELQGKLDFPLIVSKSGPRANRELKNLKEAIRDSVFLAEDFPEVVEPILAIGGWSSRARQQTAFMQPTHLEWGEECIIMPTIPSELLWENGWPTDIESSARGQITASLGIEGAIRGYSVRNRRPDLAIMDDVDDRESAASALQTATRERIIEEDIGGLAGPDKTIARLMLCSLINPSCVAATFTDRKQKPSWRGQRHKLMDRKPDAEALWDQYIELRKARADNDPDARVAHKFYLDRRAEMDAGSLISNPYRFDSRLLDDGEPSEVSALQACYNLIADRGWDHFATEYQNEPPAESGPQESGLTAALVATRLHGWPRGTVPIANGVLAIGVDIAKYWTHWVAVAFDANAAGYVVDYGAHHMKGQSPEDQVKLSLEESILDALATLRDRWEHSPFLAQGGEIVEPKFVLIDSSSGLHQRAVYQFHRQVGRAVYVPAKGFARGRGSSPFHPGKASADRKIGEFSSRVRQRDEWQDIWLYEFDADYWKRFVHQRFLTPTLDDNGNHRRGSLAIWKPELALEHKDFCRHIEAEIWVEKFEPGKGTKAGWVKRRDDNHYLDATAMACVGASFGGMRILGEKVQRKVVSMSTMQAAARGN